MGLAWQQGPLAPGAIGRFLVPDPLPERLNGAALTPADGQTFCPGKGVCSYYDIAGARRAAWSYENAWTEVRCVSGLVSHDIDRDLALDETPSGGRQP